MAQPPREARGQHDLLAVAQPDARAFVNQRAKRLEFTRFHRVDRVLDRGAGKIKFSFSWHV